MNHTIRILGVLAGLILLASAVSAAGLSITIEDASGTSGSTVDVPITVSDARNGATA